MLRDERQQQQSRQSRIGREAPEPGGDDRLGCFAVDQRRSERRIGMRPSDKHRELQAVTLLVDPRREKAEQLSRHRPRPHQHRADAGAEDRGSGQREVGFIEHVRLERPPCKIAPFIRNRFKLRQLAPLDGECARRIPISQNGAAGTGDHRGGAVARELRSGIGRRRHRHDRASAILRAADNQAMKAETDFRDEEQTDRLKYQRGRAGDRGTGDPETGDQRDAKDKIEHK